MVFADFSETGRTVRAGLRVPSSDRKKTQRPRAYGPIALAALNGRMR